MSLTLSKMRESALPSLLLAGFGLFIIVIILWLPFGFYGGDIQEHWHIRSLLTTGYDAFQEDLGELALTRPMARILFWLAYYISPESFLGDNLLLISLLWLKGLALMSVMLRVLPKQYLLAFLVGAVAILYPIDTGVSSLRIPHLHFGITAFFFALYGLLSYWQTNQARYLYLAVILLSLCCFGYEAFYPMIGLSPLLLLIYERKISKRFIKVSLAWYFPAFITLAYSYFLIFVLRFGFQSRAFQSGTPIETLLNRAISPYTNTLYSVWNIFNIPFDNQWWPAVLIGALSFFGIACYIYFANAKSQRGLSIWELFWSLLTSFLIIGLGFLVLVPTNRAEYHQNYRVFLISSVGAAAFFVLILYQIGQMSRQWGILLLNAAISIFIGLSIHFHLSIHQQYHEILYRQGRFYEQILVTLPVSTEARTLIVFPEGGTLEYDFGIPLKPHIFSTAMLYLYESSDIISAAFICNDGQTRCEINDGIITARFGGGGQRFSADTVVLYSLSADGTLRLLSSHPELPDYQISSSEIVPMPRRFATIFGGR